MGKAEGTDCQVLSGVHARNHVTHALHKTKIKLKLDQYIQELKSNPDDKPELDLETTNPVWSNIDWEKLSIKTRGSNYIVPAESDSRKIHLKYQQNSVPSGVEAEAAMVILYAQPGEANEAARFILTDEVKEKLKILDRIVDRAHDEMYHPRHKPPRSGAASVYQLRFNVGDFGNIKTVEENKQACLALDRLFNYLQPNKSLWSQRQNGWLSGGIYDAFGLNYSPALLDRSLSAKITEVLFLTAWAEETGHNYDPHADYKKLIKNDPELIVRVEQRIQDDWADFNREAILNLYNLRTITANNNSQNDDAAELKTIEFIAKKITGEALSASRNNPKENQPDRLEWRSLLHKILPEQIFRKPDDQGEKRFRRS